MCVIRNIFAESCWIPEKSRLEAIYTWSQMLIPVPPCEGGSSVYCEPHLRFCFGNINPAGVWMEKRWHLLEQTEKAIEKASLLKLISGRLGGSIH